MNSVKKSMLGLLAALVMFSLVLSGCSQRVLDFTIVSSKQMNMRVAESGKGQRVEGKHGVYWFLFIPLGSPNLKEAVDRAIEEAGPGYDALIDGVIYSQNYYYLLTAYSGYKVEGTPVKTSELIAEFKHLGKNVNLAMRNVLYHSSRGISNDETIKRLGVNDLVVQN